MWIVDSSVWIDYFNGVSTPQTDILNQTLGRRVVGLGDLILCEVLQGFRTQHEFNNARMLMLAFPVFTIGGRNTAIKCAENYRTLRALGITVRKMVDCMIATYAIERGHTLLHSDKDFKPFEIHLGLDTVKI